MVVALTKAATRRRRPIGNDDTDMILILVDKFSFPSGHATRAIMLMFLIPFKVRLHI